MGRTMVGMVSGTPNRLWNVPRKKPVYLKTPRITRHRATVRIRYRFRSRLPRLRWMPKAPSQQMRTIPSSKNRYLGPDQL